MLAANDGDTRILFRVVAQGLGDALGDLAELEYAGRFGKRAKELTSIRVTLGERTFSLSVESRGLSALIETSSGGVRIRSERVAVDAWFTQLHDELAARADSSERARSALERLALGR